MAAKKVLTMKDLIAKKGTRKQVADGVPTRIRTKLLADLAVIVDTQLAGGAVPGRVTIAKFFSERYNYHVASSTIGMWIKRLIEEKQSNGKAKEKRK